MSLEIVYDLIYDCPVFPQRYSSDVARICLFARQNNISIEELKKNLRKFSSIHKDKRDNYLVSMWLEAVERAIERQKNIVTNKIDGLLDTKLYGSGIMEYRAIVSKRARDDKLIIKFVQKIKDDSYGNDTGVPNAEHWAGTPGIYYVTTLLNHYNDILCIDGGSNWNIYGINKLRKEIEEKYGDEIESENVLKP